MPKTRSGKIMRRVTASISNFADVGDVTTAPRTPTNRTEGFGVLGMRERAALLHGTLDIQSAPGQGTTVRCTLPVQRRVEPATPGAAAALANGLNANRDATRWAGKLRPDR